MFTPYETMALNGDPDKVTPAAGGPSTGLLVESSTIEDLVKSVADPRLSDRRNLALRKWLIFCEKFQPLVREKIWNVQESQDVRRSLEKHITLSVNLGLDITKDVSVVWKGGSTRRLGEDVVQGESEAFHSLIRECRFRSHAPIWNQLAFFLGPVTVIPVIRKGRLTWDRLLPHEYEVLPDPEDPFGTPLAVVWDRRQRNHINGTSSDKNRVDVISLDDEGWRYYKVKGSKVELVAAPVPHNMGRFPGSVLRFDVPQDLSWWGPDSNARLVHATVDVAYLNSALSYVRKNQRGKKLAATGDLETMPKGQQTDNIEEALLADTGAGGVAPSIDILDYDTSPENFIKHAEWITNSIATSYGGFVSSDSSSAFGKVEFNHDALTEIRNSQIPYARDFEDDLWPKAVEMAIRNSHRDTANLPDPERVEDELRVEYSKLGRSYANPKEEREDLDWRLSRGLENYGTIMQREHPELTEEQANAAVMENLDVQMPIREKQARLNLTMVPSPTEDLDADNTVGVQGVAEQFGAMGPAVRDANKNEDAAE